ncbi:MAG TPA: DUF2721 domain-containing protein [Acidisphaera sp.]|nr:DUF2721 domain-containing protein [Acidisphaera sp.]
MLDATVHLIQVALTPVFLLSGIAALLNLYATRLAKVSDRLDSVTAGAVAGPHNDATCDEIRRLHRRSFVLDSAVVLGAVGAAATCINILTLFLLGLSQMVIASVLLVSFGAAIVCALGSIVAFGLEMLMSSRSLRIRMRFHLPSLVRQRGS